MAFRSADESAECTRNTVSLKASLASQCMMERKLKLLDIELAEDGKENWTDFAIVDLGLTESLFGLACPEHSEKKARLL